MLFCSAHSLATALNGPQSVLDHIAFVTTIAEQFREDLGRGEHATHALVGETDDDLKVVIPGMAS